METDAGARVTAAVGDGSRAAVGGDAPSVHTVAADMPALGAGTVPEFGGEAVPALFAGVVFALFGGALLVWTAVRAARRAPVVEGARPVVSVTLSGLAGAVTVLVGVWCFGRL